MGRVVLVFLGAVTWVLPLASLDVRSSASFPVELVEDRAGTLTPHQALVQTGTLRPTNQFSLGYTRSVWWVRWTASNPGEQPLDRVVRLADGFMVATLDYYEVHGDEVVRHEAQGANVRASEKPFRDPGAVFVTSWAPGETKTVLLRLQTPIPLLVSVQVSSVPAYLSSRVDSNVFLAVVLGAVLVLALYNFFVFLSLRRLEYLVYVVHALSAALYVTAQSGFGSEHFNLSGDERTQFMLTAYIIAMAILVFAWRVLEVPRYLRWFSGPLWVMVGLNAVGLVLSLGFSMKATQALQSPFILFGAAFLLVTAVAALFAGAPTARSFLLASGTFLVGVTTTILFFLGWLPYVPVVRNSYFIGIVVEGVLMSFLLTYRINTLRREKLEAQALAQTDVLTGLANRRAFFEQGRRDLDRALQEAAPLCLAMVDLDHFKAVNDLYGHAAGDAVLQAAAQVFHQNLRRGDVCGRLGGEEFGLLLPGTDLSQARALVERIRQVLAAQRVGVEGASVSITGSFGLAAGHPGESLDALVSRADRALYRAKAQGRNRVECDEGRAGAI